MRVRRSWTSSGCRRLCLTTTNDNLTAERFYLRHGLRLAKIRRGAVDDARKLKPSIPSVGESGVEIHDELEFELSLNGACMSGTAELPIK